MVFFLYIEVFFFVFICVEVKKIFCDLVFVKINVVVFVLYGENINCVVLICLL